MSKDDAAELSGIYAKEAPSQVRASQACVDDDEPDLAWASAVADELLVQLPLPAHPAEYC